MVLEPQKPRIIDRGRGPELEGTRITVFAIMEYLEGGWSVGQIGSAMPSLSLEQIEYAIAYIKEHEEELKPDYYEIMARIARGNPPEVRKKMEESHQRFLKLVEERRRAKEASGAADHGRP